ncbi:response regulator [Leptospira ognonensis]|uniref:Response regulator n=1 Tax=Leptospira ognonensis TaxID=2484945 RepID=A0A4R9JXE3_9LEPT|nr:response regulator [Leptospira ognonensis]TGL57867.1 response regulator [Leptospira ognonensis]
MSGKKAILCVDDEKMVLNSLKDQLKKHFQNTYQLEFAESAEEAMELIEEMSDGGINVLLILSDWLMPGTKGDEFLINVHEKFPGIVKILLTGQAEDNAISRVKVDANLLACLSKPWDEKDLIDTIKAGLK